MCLLLCSGVEGGREVGGGGEGVSGVFLSAGERGVGGRGVGGGGGHINPQK